MMPLISGIQKYVKERVKGQDEIVDSMVVLVCKQMLKVVGRDHGIEFDAPSTAILCGKSGTGKTYIVKCISEYISKHMRNFGLIEINCKSISQEGWAGKSLLKMLQNAPRSNYGIIFLDEFDKLTEKNHASGGEDVNYQVQTTILKYLEGYKPDDLNLPLQNFTFVLGGAFNKVYEELKEEPKNSIGFTEEHGKEDKKEVDLDMFIKHGLIPEIAGRVQEYHVLTPISEETLKDILDSENFIYEKYKKLLKMTGINITEDKAGILEEAHKSEIGVRGLIQEVEKAASNAIKGDKEQLNFEKFSPLYCAPVNTSTNEPENK